LNSESEQAAIAYLEVDDDDDDDYTSVCSEMYEYAWHEGLAIGVHTNNVNLEFPTYI
jgi:hypothetical protein